MRSILSAVAGLSLIAALSPTAARAEDQVQLVMRIVEQGDQLEVGLTDMSQAHAGTETRLRVAKTSEVLDLEHSAMVPATRLRPGHILFVVGQGAERRLLFLTPGKKVGGAIAKTNPDQAKPFDQVSLQLQRLLQEAHLSEAPVEAPVDTSVARNEARAFTFTVAFALGAPFTVAQESAIVDAIASGWSSLTKPERENYERYPDLVQLIMKIEGKEQEELRAGLETTVRQWLTESDPKHPCVAAVRAQLERKGKVVRAGEPALTEMAASAYSELYAWAELLAEEPEAAPERVTPAQIENVRRRLLASWKDMKLEERKQIATCPGLWVSLRGVLAVGSQAQAAQVRQNLARLAAKPVTAEASRPAANPAAEFAKHQSLMQIRQMTFNTYMWSRGFNYHPTVGKMW